MKASNIFFLLVAFWVANSAGGSMFNDNELSGKKERFCNSMVGRFGHESAQMNESLTPRAGDWKTHSIDEPGWFSSDLYIRKQQTTADGVYHLATCQWDEVGGFTLHLNDRYYGSVVVYYDY